MTALSGDPSEAAQWLSAMTVADIVAQLTMDRDVGGDWGSQRDLTVLVRIGRDFGGDHFPVRSIVTDMTVSPPVILIETDPIGVSHAAMEAGWRAGRRRRK